MTSKNDGWITSDIKTRCSIKRDLYLISRNSNDPIIKNYYKEYCKILTKSINEAKRSYYNKQISNSNNRIWSTWNAVKAITGRRSDHDDYPTSSIDDKSTNNFQNISNSFNNHFLSIADTIIDNIITLNSMKVISIL